MVKTTYFILAWLFFALGAVGVVVPGLPTVPLMLVALWLFARSSPRFHDWLYHHRVFGPPLQEWRDQGVIPVRAKVVAVVMMIASLSYMAWGADVSHTVIGITALVMLLGAVFILRQPSRATDSSE